jgi:hypothetical protein
MNYRCVWRKGLILAVAGLAACEEGEVAGDETRAGDVYPLTAVTFGPEGLPKVTQRTITAAEQERMKQGRAAWLARQANAGLSMTREQALAEAAGGADEEILRGAIRVDTTCAWESMWAYMSENLTGAQLCIADRGMLDLANLCYYWVSTPGGSQCVVWWNGRIRSLWGAANYGGSILGRNQPQGSCSTANTCVSWAAGQKINSLTCSTSFPLLEMGKWGPSCWLSSSAYTNIADNPGNVGHDWTNQLQGIASDKTSYWYITQTTRLRRVPLSQSMNADLGGYPNVGFSSEESSRGYAHMGDLDVFAGKIFVPMEGGNMGPAVSFRNADASLSFINMVPLTAQADAPWLAINPVDRLLYSSNYNDGTIEKYYWYIALGRLFLTHVGSVQLKTPAGVNQALRRIQGGAFSASGKMYLVSWDQDPAKAGIYGFDPEDGVQRMFRKVDYEPRWADIPAFEDPYTGDELEGIEVLDLGAGGQLHVLMVDVDSGTDDVYFKHSKISDVSKL